MQIMVEFASDSSTIKFKPVDLNLVNLTTNYSDDGEYYNYSTFEFRVPIKDLPKDFANRFIDLGYFPSFDGFSSVNLIDDKAECEFEFKYPEILVASTNIAKTYVYISLKPL